MKSFWWLYIVIVLVLVGMGFGSAYLTNSGNTNTWYKNLNQAPWTPPSIVFSVVWALLYVLMGIVLAKSVIKIHDKQFGRTVDHVMLSTFCVLLACILAWPFVYFLGKSQVGGIALLGMVVALGLAYVIMAGVTKQWVEMGCALPLVLWAGFATSLAIYPSLHK